MNFKRMLNTKIGVFFISVLLGLGLASFFYKACDGKSCLNFNGPLINEIDGKTYIFGEECYKYTFQTVPCNSTKKIIEIGKGSSREVSDLV
jgi:YHS domain-containing protein